MPHFSCGSNSSLSTHHILGCNFHILKYCFPFKNYLFTITKVGQKNWTEVHSWRWLTLSTSGQWEVVGQSHPQCICELHGRRCSSSHSAAFCVKEVEFISPKINFACVNGCQTYKKCQLLRDMWVVVKFYRWRGKTPTKMFAKIKSVFGNNCLSRTQVLALHKEFLRGRETAELCNSQRSGWPPTLSTKININNIRTLIEEDRSLTCREMAAVMDYSKSMIKNIMKKLHMRHVASMWVPHHLMKQHCWHLHMFEKQLSR